MEQEKILLHKEDLMRELNCKETKFNAIINRGTLPVVKLGADYITTKEALQKWVLENRGREFKLE